MFEYKVFIEPGKSRITLNNNDGFTFSECCQLIEISLKDEISEIEDIPVPMPLADIHRTYKLKNSEILIDLDEAWGIDIFSENEVIISKLSNAFKESEKFNQIT